LKGFTMGATVTTGRRASAFRSPSGSIVYVLFEKTYEKNCFPHTPSWSCVGLGEIKDVMQRIFAYASGCEGGSLQNRGSHISPEGYLRSWMQSLAAPTEHRDLTVSFRFEKGEYVTLSESQRDNVADALTAIDRLDVLATLFAGDQVTLSLHKDTDVILALYKGAHVSPWRIITWASPTNEEINADLGYSPKPAKTFPIEIPSALRVGEEDRLMQRPDGSWFCAGWAYSVVQDFIRNFWEVELATPKSFAKSIKAYRDAVESAPLVPLELLTVVVDTSIPVTEKYQQRSIDVVRSKYTTTSTGNGFELVPNLESLYFVAHLPLSNTSWVVSPEWTELSSASPSQPALFPQTA
jgi:hypothetical protein